MPVKQMVCSGHVHRTLVPGWREIEAALDRWDDSIWLEAEGRQLSATRIDLVANDIADALGSAQGWLVVATDEVTDTSLVLRFQDTDYVSAPVAKSAIREWADTSETRDDPPLHWTAAAEG